MFLGTLVGDSVVGWVMVSEVILIVAKILFFSADCRHSQVLVMR